MLLQHQMVRMGCLLFSEEPTGIELRAPPVDFVAGMTGGFIGITMG